MRLLNRPLAFLLAAALGVAGVFVIANVVAAATHGSPIVFDWPSWVAWAHRTRWNAGIVKVWSVIIGVVGLLLLVVELLRGAARGCRCAATTPPRTWPSPARAWPVLPGAPPTTSTASPTPRPPSVAAP